MSEVITASYRSDADTNLQGLKWANYKPVWVWWTVWILIGLFSIGGLRHFTTKQHPSVQDFVISLCPIALGVWVVLHQKSEEARMVREAQASESVGQLVTWHFSSEGFTFDEAGQTMPWTSILRSDSSKDGVIIKLRNELSTWLPKTAFTSEAEYSRFLDLLAAKTKHSKLS
jgi:hypothetical protein